MGEGSCEEWVELASRVRWKGQGEAGRGSVALRAMYDDTCVLEMKEGGVHVVGSRRCEERRFDAAAEQINLLTLCSRQLSTFSSLLRDHSARQPLPLQHVHTSASAIPFATNPHSSSPSSFLAPPSSHKRRVVYKTSTPRTTGERAGVVVVPDPASEGERVLANVGKGEGTAG